jgi:hypothetical protein
MGPLRASVIFSEPGRRLIAIEAVDFRSDITDSGCRVYGKLEPVALIVCTQDRRYALDMQARPTALDQLRQDLPELDAMMGE